MGEAQRPVGDGGGGPHLRDLCTHRGATFLWPVSSSMMTIPSPAPRPGPLPILPWTHSGFTHSQVRPTAQTAGLREALSC